MDKKKHLVILSPGSSGTNAIFDQLMNNKYILNHDNKEPFNKDSLKLIDKKVQKKDDWYKNTIIEMIKKAESLNKILLIHIKPIHLYELGINLQEGVDTLKDNFNFIFVKRNNYLARISSSFFKKTRKMDGNGKLRIKSGWVIKRLEKIDQIYGEIQQYISPYNYFIIEYEKDLHTNIRKTMDNLCSHFHIYHDYSYKQKIHNYHVVKNKWSPIKLKDKIENFDEIKDILIGTKWEWMLWE